MSDPFIYHRRCGLVVGFINSTVLLSLAIYSLDIINIFETKPVLKGTIFSAVLSGLGATRVAFLHNFYQGKRLFGLSLASTEYYVPAALPTALGMFVLVVMKLALLPLHLAGD